MLDFLTLQTTSPDPAMLTAVYTVLVSFLLSTLVGVTYIKTFRGLSYSRNYVQGLILGSIVAATVMQAIGDSLARGLGMIGALAIIRFRTNFKDPKDILFMFSALAAGIACGVGAYIIAVVGTTGFVFTAFVLHFTPLGQTSHFDGMLRFNIENNDENRSELERILKTHCKKFALISLRDMKQGERLDYAYHIKLKRNKSNADLVRTLPEKIPSVKGVHLMLQETTVEL
ncbi:DUF4956 domain-containing protein [Desulfonema magnum]|uniref:DUF4956 n=1 Tax=Desulfonema magnum TaxID=45655 RepID=A0A975GLJ5_9BACT|nr:DUF4956 domain-containing protein [Desulfonema magnum]QTA85650.1 DUF4956 [Desulfonema magnum]